MVYTVTFNPALDYVVHAENARMGEVNKISGEALTVGGKGINVSVVLAELGVKSKALGFTAGFVGEEIARRVCGYGIEADFVQLESGCSRINVKLKTDVETEFNACGPAVSDEALKAFFEKLGDISDGDALVLAGSVPESLSNNIYEHILEYVSAKNIKVAVDARGELLTGTLKYKPFLIKPNLAELGEIFGEQPSSKVEAVAYARHLQEMGARNVLVSMAGEGALLLEESGKAFYCRACQGKVQNSVGAGDSMLAGFLAGTLDNDTDNEYALMLGSAAGGATAFSDGLATKNEIIGYMKILLKEHAEKMI